MIGEASMIDENKDPNDETPDEPTSGEESESTETAEKDDGAVSDTELDDAAGGIKVWQ